MDQITENLARVRQRIRQAAESAGRDPAGIRLLAVSKTRPAAEIRAAMAAGQYAFGENYLQDAEPKIRELSDCGAEWHFIGALQSNKTRRVAELFDWVETLDRAKLAHRLNEQRPDGRPALNVLIQVRLSDEQTKAGGIEPGAVADLAAEIARMPRLRLRGLMGLPEPSEHLAAQRRPFARLHDLYRALQDDGFDLDTLSMGMSGDLEAAILEGATQVRIGTAIFGPRARRR
ncbi:MAG: YggS family pyridoxal phosphate-dependent enzyme [Gammaproteobacteria bacterium]|jgi:hypothetical protein